MQKYENFIEELHGFSVAVGKNHQCKAVTQYIWEKSKYQKTFPMPT